MQQLNRITLNPAIMGGKPCIRGQRVTVGTIVGLIACGTTLTMSHSGSALRVPNMRTID